RQTPRSLAALGMTVSKRSQTVKLAEKGTAEKRKGGWNKRRPLWVLLTPPLVPRSRLHAASARAPARLPRTLARLLPAPSRPLLPFLARGERCGNTPCRRPADVA